MHSAPKENYLGSLPRKISKPRLKMVSPKSGSLHLRLTLGSPLLTPSSPYHKLLTLRDEGTSIITQVTTLGRGCLGHPRRTSYEGTSL